MKKIIKSISAVILFVLIAFVFFKNYVYASTPDAYMIVANPGQDSSMEMNIGWHTDVENTKSYVVYTTKDDVNWNNKKQVYGIYEYVDVFNGNYSKASNGATIYEDAIFLDYSVTLTDLLPDTEYMYKVGQNVLSEVRYFKTAGNTEFSFAWISDFHTYAPIPNRLKSAMGMLETLDKYNNGFDFVFSTGDELAWGGSYSHWESLFESEYHKNYVWASTIGNHDYMNGSNNKNCNDYFKAVYNFPTNGYEGEEGVCYYFTYSNVLFITMNNETQTTATAVKKAQDWFEEVVTNNPAQYIIVSQHYQWFNGASGSFNNSTGYGRWKDLFDKYNVDLAISGNNHIYVRSKPLYQGEVSTDYRYGTTYIQTCSSDNERGSALGTLSYNQDIIEHRFSEGGNTIGGIIVNVNEENIKLELLNRKGELQDSVVIKARREVHPMDNFDKKAFEESITSIPSINDNQAILSLSEKGIGYVKKIEVLLDSNIIASSTLRKKLDTLLTVNNLPSNTTSEIHVLITYYDETNEIVKLKVNTSVQGGKLSDFIVNIVDEGYKVEFNNTYKELDKVNVYLNDTFVSSYEGGINKITVPSSTKNMDDIITIEWIMDDVVVGIKNINYYSAVDINCDGIEDEQDVLELNRLILKYNINKEEKHIRLYDLNSDNVLDIKDSTYLSMYINKKISTPKVKQYKVTFLNANGNLIDVIYVDALTDAVIDNPTLEGYTFIGWNTDITNIISDMTVKAVFSKN